MERDIEEIAATAAAVSTAAGTALDPSTILRRTIAALEPTLTISGAALWMGTGADAELVASHPRDAHLGPSAVTVPLVGPNGTIGELAVAPADGELFGARDRALLELATSQVAGAIERGRLFQEVMELERLKSDFISRVSHELRTPITIISGFIDTLLVHQEDLAVEQRQHMLERSHIAVDRLSGLIEQLLILSRLDAGVLTPDIGPVDLEAALTAVRDTAIEPEQVLVKVAPGATLMTDRALLVRALGLVVDNAIKYGGTAAVTAVLDADEGCWVVEVRDRGAGFADDVRDTAFEMFTRSSGTTAVPGLGVGLAIARTVVEVLDGQIGIDHDHGGPGALVRVRLPAR